MTAEEMFELLEMRNVEEDDMRSAMSVSDVAEVAWREGHMTPELLRMYVASMRSSADTLERVCVRWEQRIKEVGEC